MSLNKKTIVTVCKNTVLSNQKHGTREPAIRVLKEDGKVWRGHKAYVIVDGKAIGCFIYDHDNKKPWGARAWFETIGDTKVIVSTTPLARNVFPRCKEKE